MTVLYVASDVPGAGRTAFCTALAATLIHEGQSVALFKPLTVGDPSRQDRDGPFFQQIRGVLSNASVIWPAHLNSSERVPEEHLRQIQGAAQELASQADVLLVEGLPLKDGEGQPVAASTQLADALDARVVGVLGYSPELGVDGAAPLQEAFGPRLAGVLLNQVTRYKGHHVRTRLLLAWQRTGLSVLGAIPEDRRLRSATTRQAVDHLGGRFVTGNEKGDLLVEHFLIGGPILESGVDYFGRHESKAVLVRGNRPDIQMAALSTPTACLILTGGFDPIQYVLYEAQEEEVPLVVLDADTHQAAARLESLFEQVTFHHPVKLERFQHLLADSVSQEAFAALLRP